MKIFYKNAALPQKQIGISIQQPVLQGWRSYRITGPEQCYQYILWSWKLSDNHNFGKSTFLVASIKNMSIFLHKILKMQYVTPKPTLDFIKFPNQLKHTVILLC